MLDQVFARQRSIESQGFFGRRKNLVDWTLVPAFDGVLGEWNAKLVPTFLGAVAARGTRQCRAQGQNRENLLHHWTRIQTQWPKGSSSWLLV